MNSNAKVPTNKVTATTPYHVKASVGFALSVKVVEDLFAQPFLALFYGMPVVRPSQQKDGSVRAGEDVFAQGQQPLEAFWAAVCLFHAGPELDLFHQPKRMSKAV